MRPLGRSSGNQPDRRTAESLPTSPRLARYEHPHALPKTPDVQRFSPAVAVNRDGELITTDNGLHGGGTVSTTTVLGRDGVLPPDGVSGAVRWRLKRVEPIRVPNLHLYVTSREVVGSSRQGLAPSVVVFVLPGALTRRHKGNGERIRRKSVPRWAGRNV